MFRFIHYVYYKEHGVGFLQLGLEKNWRERKITINITQQIMIYTHCLKYSYTKIQANIDG